MNLQSKAAPQVVETSIVSSTQKALEKVRNYKRSTKTASKQLRQRFPDLRNAALCQNQAKVMGCTSKNGCMREGAVVNDTRKSCQKAITVDDEQNLSPSGSAVPGGDILDATRILMRYIYI